MGGVCSRSFRAGLTPGRRRACGGSSAALVRPQLGRADPENRHRPVPGNRPGERRSRRWPRLRSGGTRSRTPSALTLRPVRRGGRRSARKRSRTGSRPRSTATGTGTLPRRDTGREAGGVPQVREERPGPGPGHLHHRSHPGRAGPPPCDPPPDRDRPRPGEHPQAERLIAKGPSRVLAVTVSRKGTRLVAAFRVVVRRPQQAGAACPTHGSGWTSACGCLPPSLPAAVEVIERVPNPRPLAAALKNCGTYAASAPAAPGAPPATPRPTAKSPGCTAGPPASAPATSTA